MKFDVLNRWTGKVRFTADIEVPDGASMGVKLGLAVTWARANGANLRGANLRDADLSGADLRDANLSGADLSDANLNGADLSDANLSGAILRDADLSDAILRDADLNGADLRDADLSDAILSDANLRDADFNGADLSDANLSGADLSGAILRGANLSGAILRDANLRDADLRGVPKIPDIHKAVYAAASQPEALNMSAWHCGTSHCRAGWVVTLAGDAGAALEWAVGTSAAAAVIYLASDPKLERVPTFHATNKEALADMKRLAEMAPC